MPALVTLNAVAAATPDGRTLFENLDLSLSRERIGLIGANGVGKTTLFKLITGDLQPAAGTIRREGTVGRMKQDLVPAPGETLADAFGVRHELAVLGRALAGEGSLADMAEADWTIESRLEEALSKVGLESLNPDHALAELSGGQRTRVALSALLFASPDILLLDEPTNDLDAEGRAAIATALRSWRGGAMVISHDRTLLREMDRIVEISSVGTRSYGGNWDHYAEQKATELAAVEAERAHAEKELAASQRKAKEVREKQDRRNAQGHRSRAKGDMPKILLNARRQRAENTTARLKTGGDAQIADAREALKDAETRAETLAAPRIDLPSTGVPAGRTMLEITDLAVGRSGATPLYRDFKLAVRGPERIALVGGNGSGKTTLLHLIAGHLPVTQGTMRRNGRMALLDQHVGLLDPAMTIRDNFKLRNPDATETDCRAALARFLFRADAALRTVGSLSGGEKLRAGLASTLGASRPPEILLLDEPTNHLDLQAIEAIEAGLSAYDGVLIVASHDPDFLQAIGTNRTIILPPG